jgi:hypothetical protein
MTNIQKLFLALFVIFLAVIPVWRFLVAPGLEKMPGNYEASFNLLGTEKPNYEIGGNSSELLIYNGRKETSWFSLGAGEVSVDLLFKAETINGEPLFETTKKYEVEVNTRKIVSKDDSSGYFIPPTHLEKKNYLIQDPTIFEDLELIFVKEDGVMGLPVYNFKGNLTNINSTGGYEFLKLVPEVYSTVDDVTSELWIEPVSGIIVDFKQSGASYYIDRTTNNRIHNLTNYTNKYSDDSIANQVRIAQNEKQKIQLYEIWIPILLGILSLASLIALFASRKVALPTSKSRRS